LAVGGVGVGSDDAALPVPQEVLIARTRSAIKMNEAEYDKALVGFRIFVALLPVIFPASALSISAILPALLRSFRK